MSATNPSKNSWVIKNDRLNEGVTYALKNSDSLYQSAKILFDNGRYAHALSIATLALEEFGKHCILKEHWMNRKDVGSSLWVTTILKHDKKLKAIPAHLDQYTPKNASKAVKQQLKKYKRYLLKLAKIKLENLYVDWDKINKEWLIVENSKSMKAKADFAVRTAHWTIEKYIEDLSWDRDLIFTPANEISKLFNQNKVYAFCNICANVMLTRGEILSHHRIFPAHDRDVSWHNF